MGSIPIPAFSRCGLNGKALFFDINDKGEVVGFSRVSSGQAHAFLYKNGIMYDLGTLGGIDSRANAINNRGDIVGQFTNADGSVHAFLYRDGQMVPL